MESGYKIIWATQALSDLKDILDYLEKNWTEKELKKFSRELDHTIQLITISPELFPKSEKKTGIRKVVISKYNTLYYWKRENVIEILSIFSNRQDPDKIKF